MPDLASASYIASPCNSGVRLKQRRVQNGSQICRLTSWCKVLLNVSCCWVLALSGCGANLVNEVATGALTASPNSVFFGAVSIGQSASTPVSLLNRSSATVEITQINLTGESFSVVSPSDFPVTITAGGTYRLNVQFNPTAAGTATGQLTIGSNSSTNSTAVISLSGTGTTAPAALGALSCSSGAMTGSGADACTVTLTAAAPSGGLIVNLSSSRSAVTVPATVTVPAGAASAGFTATVSPVATAQAVKMTANVGSVFTTFTLQLNTAIAALSINTTSVAFGDVVVNTTATQPVTLTSAGTVPVTIAGAALTGAGFTVSGPEFPTTLNPGQAAGLNIEFNPSTVGAAAGQVTLASNSSTDPTAVISLSGTGTAAPVVAVAVTPAAASVIAGATQQFTATVIRTPNTAVTWSVSGIVCSSGTSCGTISSSGLYTAPAAVPSSAIVTITATSMSDPTKSASVNVSIVPPQATGYNLVWEDTFSTLSLCTTNVPGCNWYNFEMLPGSPAGIVTDPSGTYVNLEWASGESYSPLIYTNISTSSSNGVYNRSWTYGYFEVSMAFNPTTGSFPGIWMLPISMISAGNPLTMSGGELDIFEWQSTSPTFFNGTVHVWANGVDTANNKKSNAWAVPEGTNFATYNKYGVLWTPTAISWYFNDVLMETVNTAVAPYNAVFGASESYSLLLSQQAGCNWSASCTGQVSPLNMRIQWAHVYASAAE